MYSLFVTAQAENDLDDIVAYITQKLFNPSAAGELLDGVEACYEKKKKMHC